MSEKKNGLTRRDVLSIGSAAGATALVTLGSSPALAGAKLAKLPQVPRRVLGKTKETVPILLVGCAMKFDLRFDPKLAEAMRFGVNYFDCADCYAGGTSETAVGNFMQRAKARKDVWITTKSDAHDPAGLKRTLETSLKKLKTDRVEMLYLHALNDLDTLNSDVAKAAEELKKAGKIKHFGFSCHGGVVAELLDKAAGLSWIDSIMFKYNFRSYGEKELNAAIDKCAKANIGLIAMKTQGSEASFSKAWKKYEQTGKWTKHQAVLKAVWADERISAAVSHMDTFEKLKQNIAAALDVTKLSQAEQDALRKYAEATRHLACEGCDHLCNPAVDAPVQIGTTMRYLMYHDSYGEMDKAKEMFAALPEGAKKIEGVDFSGATRACPHGIDVAWHMNRAKDVLA
jgi:predicted aldo/keto reductase-like oxidoreductase